MEQAARQRVAALLKARDAHLAAQAQASEARQAYIAAEKTYIDSFRDQPAANVVVDGALVMVRDEWYDAKEGERLEFHTVEVL